MPMMQTRRRFMTSLSVAGAAGLLHAPPSRAAEGALETTSVRIAKIGAICLAPQYVSEELLRADGFTDISYVEVSDPVYIARSIGRGEADFSTSFAIDPIQAIDSGGADRRARRRPCRLLRAIRQTGHSPYHRPQGEKSRRGQPFAA